MSASAAWRTLFAVSTNARLSRGGIERRDSMVVNFNGQVPEERFPVCLLPLP